MDWNEWRTYPYALGMVEVPAPNHLYTVIVVLVLFQTDSAR